MKKYETSNGTIMVSGNVELDTDDMVESEVDPIKELATNVNKLAQQNSLENYTESSTTVTLVTTTGVQASGILEKYHCYVNSFGKQERVITAWYSYDDFVKLTDYDISRDIVKCYINFYKDKKDIMFDLNVPALYLEFEIIQIKGPLFKTSIKLADNE